MKKISALPTNQEKSGIQESPKAATKKPLDLKLRKQAFRLGAELDAIGERAKEGDFQAIVHLHTLTLKCVLKFQLASSTHPQLVRKLAADKLWWPVIMGRGKSLHKELETFFDTIGLGMKIAGLSQDQIKNQPTDARKILLKTLRAILNQRTALSNKFYSLTKTNAIHNHEGFLKFCEQQAGALIDEWKIKKLPYRQKKINQRYVASYLATIMGLKDLDIESKEDWFDCIEMYLNITCKGFPEKDPAFRWFGIYRAKNNDAELGSRTSETNIRYGIFKSLKTALGSMLKEKERNPRHPDLILRKRQNRIKAGKS